MSANLVILIVMLGSSLIGAEEKQKGVGDGMIGGAMGNKVRMAPIAKGWSKSEVNAVIFRQHPVTTHGKTQYAAFYDEDGYVVLARRELTADNWDIRRTRYKGRVADAHNSISIAVDGEGRLHMAWDHHGDVLRYCRSTRAGGLELSDKMVMTGQNEQKVTYPEFYNLPGGDLLFLYRDGVSGNGNLMLNRYDLSTGKWSVVQHPLIDGEGRHNAYWQAAIDDEGGWHISWCWREHGGVETNHDICYARSGDGGKSWQKSTGEKYKLPITAGNAEYVRRIAQKSELINQTSMTVDKKGRPMIATYWRGEGEKAPQYYLIYYDSKEWQTRQVSRRKSSFTLSGGGTKRLPMSRPKVLVDDKDNVYVIFRDAERGSCVSVAISEDAGRKKWRVEDLTAGSLELWEPGYDKVLWRRDNVVHLLVQKVSQGADGGVKLADLAAQMVSILEWKP
jgi:hypothetical protein